MGRAAQGSEERGQLVVSTAIVSCACNPVCPKHQACVRVMLCCHGAATRVAMCYVCCRFIKVGQLCSTRSDLFPAEVGEGFVFRFFVFVLIVQTRCQKAAMRRRSDHLRPPAQKVELSKTVAKTARQPTQNLSTNQTLFTCQSHIYRGWFCPL